MRRFIVYFLVFFLLFSASAEEKIMLDAYANNWGLVNGEEDYHSSSMYRLTYNGDLYYHENYNKSGKRNEIKTKISSEDFQKIHQLLVNQVQSEEDYDAVDGIGWYFIFYDENEEEIYDFRGYIYDTYKEEIIEILAKYIPTRIHW